MQDVVCVKGCFMEKEDQDFLALFDGHGGRLFLYFRSLYFIINKNKTETIERQRHIAQRDCTLCCRNFLRKRKTQQKPFKKRLLNVAKKWPHGPQL